MTTFLVDVSGAYSNLSGVKAAGAAGVISRCMTEPGTIDRAYAPTQAAAQAIGLMGGAYCFLTGDFSGMTVEQRAERFIAAIGDPSELVIGLDTETPTYPSLHPAATASDIARWMIVWRAHYPSHPVLDYLPRWYWTGHMTGSPDLSSVGPLWASAYPGWTSFADYTSHGGDSNPEWTLAYAGYPRPALWQFAGSVSIGGVNADLSAFRGTLDEFRALALGGSMAPHVKPGGPVLGTVTFAGSGHALISTTDTSVRYGNRPAGEVLYVVAALNLVDANGKPIDIDGHQPPVSNRDQVWLVDETAFGASAYALRADCTALVPVAPALTQADVNAAYLGGKQAGYDLAVNGAVVDVVQPQVHFPARPA